MNSSFGQATQMIQTAASQVVPAGVQGSLQGDAATFQSTVSNLVALMFVAIFVMYVIPGRCDGKFSRSELPLYQERLGFAKSTRGLVAATPTNLSVTDASDRR
jgi:hypothetical protein